MKFDLDAAAEFAGNLVLASWGGADLQAHSQGGTVKGLDAQDARAIDEGLRPGRVAAHFGGSGFQGMHAFFEGHFGRNGNVHESLRPVAAKIADAANFAVGNGHERSASVAQNGAAQGQDFDAPRDVSNLDCITHDELVFEDDVEAGDEVSDEILGAKTDGDASEAGESKGGSGVNAYFVDGGEEGNEPDDFAGGAVKDASESASLLFANLSGAALGGGGFDDEFGKNAEETIGEQRDEEDGCEVKYAA